MFQYTIRHVHGHEFGAGANRVGGKFAHAYLPGTHIEALGGLIKTSYEIANANIDLC